MKDRELLKEIASLKSEIKRLRTSLSEVAPPLSALLRMRGFRIYKKEPADDLLLPQERFIDDYYAMLQKYSFRLFLRDVIKHRSLFTLKDVARYATQEVTEEYIDHLLGIRLVERSGNSYFLKRQPVKSFGPTLEWLLSEILRREFSAESIWGIKFKRHLIGGDYDLIAKLDCSMLYMEVKSSPPKQIYPNEVSAFFDRVFDLLPNISVFFMDTELRMKDKIVPMFEDEIKNRPLNEISAHYGITNKNARDIKVDRIEKELFHIKNKTFIINSKDSIVNNIEKVLIRYFRGPR